MKPARRTVTAAALAIAVAPVARRLRQSAHHARGRALAVRHAVRDGTGQPGDDTGTGSDAGSGRHLAGPVHPGRVVPDHLSVALAERHNQGRLGRAQLCGTAGSRARPDQCGRPYR